MVTDSCLQISSHCKLHPILGNIYMSRIHHAMTERFFGTSCIYHTTTKLPNPCFQNTSHVVFHIRYASWLSASHYHTIHWTFLLIPNDGKESGFLKESTISWIRDRRWGILPIIWIWTIERKKSVLNNNIDDDDWERALAGS